MRNILKLNCLLLFVSFIFISKKTYSQSLPTYPALERTTTISSGIYDGEKLASDGLWNRSNYKDTLVNSFTAVINEEHAPWIQLKFADYNLGDHSFIKIKSSEDNAIQIHNSKTLDQWNGTSAFFNGDEITVSLFVSSLDKEVFFTTKKILFEVNDAIREKYKNTSVAITCGGCDNGPTDDRVPSTDPAIGRLVKSFTGSPSSSTAWIASNGTLVTAGHAIEGHGYLEFNVPLSNSDGTYNHPSPSDQYIVDNTKIIYTNGGSGDDWAVFNVYPNTNTGLLPHVAQNSFYRTTLDRNPSQTRVTGFGADFDLVSCDLNQFNKTQQTDIGPTGSEIINGDKATWTAYLDVQGGVSGGPMIDPTNNYAVGIITHCSPSVDESISGTSNENNNYEAAMNTFHDLNSVYADADHSEKFYSDGSASRPYNTLSNAISASSNNDLLVLTHSYFDEQLTISKPLTLIAPAGKVVIGKSGVFSKLNPYSELEETIVNLEADSPSKITLSQNYPNPFNPSTVITYTVPEKSFVDLRIYNLLGQHIQNLVHSEKNPGAYKITFDRSNLSSGIYIYQLKIENTILEKTMTMIK